MGERSVHSNETERGDDYQQMKYPIEFYHFGYDWQFRDAQKKTVMKVDINGFDFLAQKEVEKLGDKIVELLNREAVQRIADETAPEVSQDAPKPSENGHSSPEVKKRGNPYGRKGKPK